MAKIITDYGGVLTKGSRQIEVADLVCEFNRADYILLQQFIHSQTYADLTLSGQRDEFLDQLGNFGFSNALVIYNLFKLSCVPDMNAMRSVLLLRQHHEIILVSDSVAPYSEYIRENFSGIFEDFFFSNEYGKKKKGGLYACIESRHPGVLSRSYCIDDNAKNFYYPKQLGATCFTSIFQARKLLGLRKSSRRRHDIASAEGMRA